MKQIFILWDLLFIKFSNYPFLENFMNLDIAIYFQKLIIIIGLIDNLKTMIKSHPTKYQKSLVAFLYFIQGIFLVIPSTIILTYKQMPSYSILSLFSFAVLPFSFKFIAAPLIEKFTIKSYGRRKTWVVISLVIGSIFLILASYFTKQSAQQQKYLAVFLTAATFMIAIEDISTDALAVKQLQSSELASYMQCVMQPIGGVVGSLVFLQLVSGSIYLKLGFSQPFITVGQYLQGLSILTLISAFVIHLTYKQKLNQEQKKHAPHSLWEVIKNYKYFVDLKYSNCRQCIVFLLHFHGIVYFSSSVSVQLIKKNIISKDGITTLSNLIIIPVFFLTTLLRKRWADLNMIHKRTRFVLSLRLCFMIILFFGQFTNTTVIYFIFVILALLSNTQFFLNSMICNNFTQSRFAGMYVTMMASFTNFGNNSTIQLKVIGEVGYQNAVIFGFLYTIAVILSYGRVQRWIKNGLTQQGQQNFAKMSYQ